MQKDTEISEPGPVRFINIQGETVSNQNTNKNGKTTVWARVPVSLAENSLVQGIGVALFYLSCGEKPKSVPSGEYKMKRFNLTPKELDTLEELLPHFNSKQDLITSALAWLDERPKHVRFAKIE